MSLFAKSPMQMRREAEMPKRSFSPPSSANIDAASRPQLASENADEITSTIEWFAHLTASRIEVG